eukprot:5732193-Prymnesium_polylepis.1
MIEEGQAAYEEAAALSAKDKKAPVPDEFDPSALPREQRWLAVAKAESGRRLALQVRRRPLENGRATMAARAAQNGRTNGRTTARTNGRAPPVAQRPRAHRNAHPLRAHHRSSPL